MRRWSKTGEHSPFGSGCLDLCEHNNWTLMRNKTSWRARSGVFALIPYKWFVCSELPTNPGTGTNSLDMFSLALVQLSKWTIWSQYFYLLLWSTAFKAPLIHLFTHYFINYFCVWCPTCCHRRCSYHDSVPQCKACPAHMRQWRMGLRKTLRRCVLWTVCSMNAKQSKENMQIDSDQIICFGTKHNSPGVKAPLVHAPAINFIPNFTSGIVFTSVVFFSAQPLLP